jgi:thiol-disulfide isomerase/thioredoxin
MTKLFLVVVFSALFNTQPIASRLKDFNGKSFMVKPTGKSVAYIFLSTECPLCQNYAPVLQSMQTNHPDIQFYGIVSGTTFSKKDVATFAKEYGITFPVLMDPAKNISSSMNATVTPEVILIGSTGKEYYRGLIDDWVAGLGKTRKIATKKYLEQAINSIETGGGPVAATTPIGCLISNF